MVEAMVAREMSAREKLESRMNELIGQSKDCTGVAHCLAELLSPKTGKIPPREIPAIPKPHGWLEELDITLGGIGMNLADTLIILTRLRKELKPRIVWKVFPSS